MNVNFIRGLSASPSASQSLILEEADAPCPCPFIYELQSLLWVPHFKFNFALSSASVSHRIKLGGR